MDIMIPEKFAEFQHLIKKFYREDATFKEILEDYHTYLDALQYWERSTSKEAPALRSEYTELVGELEDELTQFLENQ